MVSEERLDSKVRADGATAFVLGNGPSLASVSLPALSGYATIGMNAAYRYWREIDWRPRFYACVDTVVGMSHKDEIAALIEEGRIERFLLRSNLVEALGATALTPRVVNFEAERQRQPLLAVNPPTTGSHAALWAGAMGYEKVVMLGVDAQYKEIVAGARRGRGIELEIVEERDNPNYFFKGYQQAGDKYNIPNPKPDLHVNAWRRAGAALGAAGVSVFNGNPQSGVRCFPFVDLNALLDDGAAPVPADEPVLAGALGVGAALSEPSAGQRFKTFARGQGPLAAAGLVGLVALFSLWAALTKPSPALLGFAVIAAGLNYLLFAALLYVRFAVISYLHRQDEDFAGVKARLADLERNSPASTPSGRALSETGTKPS